MGGAGNFRQRPVASTGDYMLLDQMLPALHAAEETGTTEQILSRLKAFFNNASDTLRHHETPYRLQLFSGDVAGALDTLERATVDTRCPQLGTFMNQKEPCAPPLPKNYIPE